MTVGVGGGYDYATIQAGIDAATHGDTVVVYPGTYVENIHFNGKNIVLRSTDPLDAATVAATIIDGNQSGSVVTFSGGESPTCVLSGFTIARGDRWSPDAPHGGGIDGNGTYASIHYNDIIDNWAFCSYWDPIHDDWRYLGKGGGLYGCHGTIQNNTITSNTAGDVGGGLRECDGTIQNNTITSNAGGNYGGGLYGCDGTIRNNGIAGNSAYMGGGLYRCDGAIQNNTITGNAGGNYGGGLYRCDGMIQSNTITGNSAKYGGGGLYECDGTIRNCIIWGNSAPAGPQLDQCSTPSYSCIQDWSSGGKGNISHDPLFTTGPLGPYYLSQTTAGQAVQSPCVDAGWGAAVILGLSDRSTRTDGWVDTGIVDMGYHYPFARPPRAAIRFGRWSLCR